MVNKTSKESPRMKEMKHKSRRLSIKEGIFTSIRDSFGGNYLSPFAIAINASNSLVAMLSSVQGLLGPLSQMFGSRLIEKQSRKKILRKSVFYETLMWILFIGIAVLFAKGIIANVLPLMLLLTFSFYVILSNIGYPAWFSWIGDLVDDEYRGRWFSKRNLFIGFVSVILAVSASFFLDFIKTKGMIMQGFIILFALAFLARIVSWGIFKKQYEPKIKLKKGSYFSFWNFLSKAPKSNFGKFAIFRMLLNFSITICAALVSIYLLRDLNLNYTNYIIIIFSATIFSLIVMEIWGLIADNFGDYKVFSISAILISLIPIAWIINTSVIYLILVPGLIRGVSWAGLNLATGNFIYDNVSKEKRGFAVSYYNVLGGIGTFLGAGVGAILIKFLKTGFMKPIVLIFIISAILRLGVALWWIPKIKEVKKDPKMSSMRKFRKFVMRQTKPTIKEEAHELMSIRQYIFEK